MKMIMAIISNKDIDNVLSAIAKEGFFATKISTTGQFLVDGHSAIIIGTEKEKVDTVYEILANNVTKRKIKRQGVTSTLNGSLLKEAVDVEEYGGVAFTINIEDHRKF